MVKYNKASAVFLARKLWIDFKRAETLLRELEKNGVVGPQKGIEPRKVNALKDNKSPDIIRKEDFENGNR